VHQRNIRNTSDRMSRKKMRTKPEALQAVARAKGKRNAEREGENIVRDHVEGRAEVLAALSAQHTPARAGQAIRNLERGDERHHFTYERHDLLVIGEEVTENLFFWFILVEGEV